MKNTFTRAKWTMDSEGIWLMLNVGQEARQIAESIQGKMYDLEIKVHREKRSLNANNYSWMLTDRLADKMLVAGVKLSKDEMHAEMIYRYGQTAKDEDGNTIVQSVKSNIKAKEFFLKQGVYAHPFAESELNGTRFTHYRIYKGSHEYNTEEMSVFIRGIVEECKEQGIETMTLDEIAKLEGILNA